VSPDEAEGWLKMAIAAGSAAVGTITTWALMRRDVSDLKKAVEGGPDDWAVPEMRRRLKAAFIEIDRLKDQTRALELADAKTLGELKGLEERVAAHAKRTIENGQEGYRKLFNETLDRQDVILRRIESIGGRGE
jgi:hypothetical protein